MERCQNIFITCSQRCPLGKADLVVLTQRRTEVLEEGSSSANIILPISIAAKNELI